MASSGVPALDKLLNGGYPERSAVLIEGPSSNEKEALGYEFVRSGLDRGDFCIYVTSLSPSEVLSDAKALDIDLDRGTFWMCPEKGNRSFAPGDLASISFGVKGVLRENSSRKMRVVFDFSSQLLMSNSSDLVYRFLEQLLSDLKKYDAIFLATVQEDMHEPKVLASLELIFDGAVVVSRAGGTEVGVRVKKMRGVKSTASFVLFPIGVGGMSTTQPTKHRVAILPFVNMSPDPNEEYLADGITEEMISTVSGISGLNVISRTSVMGYKGTAKKLGDIGKELDVGSILEGSVRKSGNKVRITAQLIDVGRDTHLWAQNYDRELDDVFAVQSEIARNVADVLRVRILPTEKERVNRKPTDNTVAYTLFLKGMYIWNMRGAGDVIKLVEDALECFAQAAKEDPNFASAYVAQARCYVKIAENGKERAANLQSALTQVDMALKIDPGLAEAYATKGMALVNGFQPGQAEEMFKRAIQLNPSDAYSHMLYGLKLHFELRLEEALDQFEEAMRLDPLSAVTSFNVGDYWYYSGRYPKALEYYRRSVELGAVAFRWRVAETLARMKMYDEAKKEFAAYSESLRAVPDLKPFADTLVDFNLAYLFDDRQAVRRLLPKLQEMYGSFSSYGHAFGIASAYFYLGNFEKGFEWLEESYAKKEYGLLYIQLDPDVGVARKDPRYLDLVNRVGLGLPGHTE